MLDRALESIARMPQEGLILKAALDLRLVAVSTLLPLAQTRRMFELLSEAEHLATLMCDERRLCAIYNQYSMARFLSGEFSEALESSQRGAALARARGDQPTHLISRFVSGQACHGLGRFRASIEAQLEVIDAFSGAMESERGAWAGYPALHARAFLISSCLELGMLDEARRAVEYGSALAERIEHPFSQAFFRCSVGLYLMADGRPKEAVALMEKTLELCIEAEVRTLYPTTVSRLALAHLSAGQLPQAEQALEPMLRNGAIEPETDFYSWLYVLRAASELRLRQGHLDDARRLARLATDACRRSGAMGELAKMQGIVARIEVACEPANREASAEACTEAIQIADRLEMKLLRGQLAETKLLSG
jgi:tetratricopeptide (TPR) repeat protein